ncbi:MAG: hypothetical protein ACKVP7_27970 [Hyphomicrobiaceae bacterium]
MNAAVYQSFGIDGNWELPVPSRFVVDKAGIVRGADADPNYSVRPEASATPALLRSIA